MTLLHSTWGQSGWMGQQNVGREHGRLLFIFCKHESKFGQ